MFKKTGAVALTGLLLFGCISPISSEASSRNLEVFKTEDAMYDLQEISEKSSVKEKVGSVSNSLFSATTSKSNPINSSSVKRFLIPPLISATAITQSTVKEDFIQAKVRAYNDGGGLYGSKTDTGKKSSYAGIEYVTKTKWISFAYGNHVYKLSGYKDVYHETTTR